MSGSSLSPIVVLTGAGISADSGVATFRGAGGLWEGHRVEEVATPQAFARNPDLVQRFYNLRRAHLQSPTLHPNAAHAALARLEQAWPAEVLIVTQNVDDLHERAGSRNLVHMHGELMRARCLACRGTTPWSADLDQGSVCPSCQAAGRMRPDIVWFGEMPMHMDRILAALERCDLFLAVGTSGQVYPAAGFVEIARQSGAARAIEINLEPSAVSAGFTEHRRGRAAEVVPELVAELLAGAAPR
jgi:NAD-dependent deacetylase